MVSSLYNQSWNCDGSENELIKLGGRIIIIPAIMIINPCILANNV